MEDFKTLYLKSKNKYIQYKSTRAKKRLIFFNGSSPVTFEIKYENIDKEIFLLVNEKLKESEPTFLEEKVINFPINTEYKTWIEETINIFNSLIIPNKILRCVYYNAIYYFLRKANKLKEIVSEGCILIDGMNLINDREFLDSLGNPELPTFEKKISTLIEEVKKISEVLDTKIILFHQENSSMETPIIQKENLFICSPTCYLSSKTDYCKDYVKNETDDIVLCLCYLANPTNTIITKDKYSFLEPGYILSENLTTFLLNRYKEKNEIFTT